MWRLPVYIHPAPPIKEPAVAQDPRRIKALGHAIRPRHDDAAAGDLVADRDEPAPSVRPGMEDQPIDRGGAGRKVDMPEASTANSVAISSSAPSAWRRVNGPGPLPRMGDPLRLVVGNREFHGGYPVAPASCASVLAGSLGQFLQTACFDIAGIPPPAPFEECDVTPGPDRDRLAPWKGFRDIARPLLEAHMQDPGGIIRGHNGPDLVSAMVRETADAVPKGPRPPKERIRLAAAADECEARRADPASCSAWKRPLPERRASGSPLHCGARGRRPPG